MSELLTVVIPTYNRAKWLEKALVSILQTPPAVLENTKIVVCDNASSDETPVVVERLRNSFPRFDYVARRENIGATANVIAAYSYGTAEYNYVLGDDDVILPTTLGVIQSELAERPDLVLLNRKEYDETFTAVRNHNALGVSENRLYCDRNLLLRDFGITIGMISGIVIRQKFLIGADPTKCEASCYAHLYHIYTSLPSPMRVKVLTEQLVLCRVPPIPQDIRPLMAIDGLDEFFEQLAAAGYDKKICKDLSQRQRAASAKSAIKAYMHGYIPRRQALTEVSYACRRLPPRKCALFYAIMMLPKFLFVRLYRTLFGVYAV
jgi:hypothetical protein